METGRFYILILAMSLIAATVSACALFPTTEEPPKPISNPFYSYQPNLKSESPLILRSKKGDRSVEVEIPGDTQNLSEFVLPVSPAFKVDGGRSPSSVNSDSDDTLYNENLMNHAVSPSDQEITRSFSQGPPEQNAQRQDIEQSLHLIPSDDDTPKVGSKSYLASLDHIKQLYRSTRFEAALLETDDMIKQYQTDPELYEMRGTLLDRLGRRELALKSWNQALKIQPQNAALRKFIEQKQSRTTAGLE